MNIVVFGGAGWVGRPIVDNLSKNHEVRAFDIGPEAWASQGMWTGGEVVHGDIEDYSTVDQALEGMDAIVHVAVYFSSEPGAYGMDDQKPFLINLKGLWNVLEAARQRGIKRIVHIGSCQVVHPDGVFFSADVRRPDGSLYAVTKRLQEEMCRQFYDAFGMSIVVLRPCSVIDAPLGIGKDGKKLENWGESWVCRHDIAEACRLSVEKEEIEFEVLHVAGAPEADQYCNVKRTRDVLSMTFYGAPE